MQSFAFISREDIDIIKLKESTENFFKIKCRSISNKRTSAIDSKRQFIVSLSSKKIHFILSNEDCLDEVVQQITGFISTLFKNKTLGIKFYDQTSNSLFKDATNLDLINF